MRVAPHQVSPEAAEKVLAGLEVRQEETRAEDAVTLAVERVVVCDQPPSDSVDTLRAS